MKLGISFRRIIFAEILLNKTNRAKIFFKKSRMNLLFTCILMTLNISDVDLDRD